MSYGIKVKGELKMNVTIRKISGIDDAINTMFISKRTWTPELEQDIYDTCSRVLDRNGFIKEDTDVEDYAKFSKWMDSLVKLHALIIASYFLSSSVISILQFSNKSFLLFIF